MLSAYDKNGEDVIAREVTRELGPFSCPECGERVVVKKGPIKAHHFAHLNFTVCTYNTGESEEHRRNKYLIYDALRSHPAVSKLKLERYLKEVRPDISFCLEEKFYVAIELQISPISVDEIARRTRFYTAKNIAVLWITPYHNRMSCFTPYRTRVWERYLHALYFGKVYYWLGGEELLPVHFTPYSLGTEYNEWYGENKHEPSAEPFERFSPSLKNLDFGDPVDITDMKVTWRPYQQWRYFTLPRAQLWIL